jgi:hypothetical protein
MTAALDIPETSFLVPVLLGAFNVPLSESVTEASLEIMVPEVNYRLGVTLMEITFVTDASSLIAQTVIDGDVEMALAFSGKRIENGAVFQVQQASVQIRPLEDRARAEFMESTLNALLALAEEVRLAIPEIDLDLKLRFNLPLLNISRLLQARQTAYRLMVIEAATGNQFSLPPHFSPNDMSAIIFAFLAITERSFDWQFDTYMLPFRANDAGLNQLMQVHQSATFTINQEEVPVLDKSVLLGDARVTVADAIIENFDQVKKALEKLDDTLVQVVIRSATGRATFELTHAPHLPDNPWPANIQTLVELESQLDTRLVSRYHALAASTLEGLTVEEKAAVTTRPELDEEAFAIEDWDKENL